ncbi:MAG TPA: patatin-like phospholipase family protein [Candidatus Dormibacteraeota bacterium]
MTSAGSGGPAGPMVLVLAGGGSRGAMEVGALAVLAEHGFRPDHVVGTSAGALNAAMVAALPLPQAVERLIASWDSPATRAVFHASPRELIRNVAARHAWLRSDQPLRHLVRTTLRDLEVRRFEDLRLPLSVLVTDFGSGHAERLTQGNLEEALVASCSVPGIFPPVVSDGHRLVDGGVLENCSLSTAVELHPRLVVAIDVSGAGGPPPDPSFLEVVDRTLGLAQRARLLADLRIHSERVPIALLCPRPSRHIGLLEPVDSGALIELTAAATRGHAAMIFGTGGEPSPGLHDIPVDLAELTTAGRARPAAARARPTAAARGARWTRALARARREGAWIEVPKAPPEGQ